MSKRPCLNFKDLGYIWIFLSLLGLAPKLAPEKLLFQSLVLIKCYPLKSFLFVIILVFTVERKMIKLYPWRGSIICCLNSLLCDK